MEEVADAVRAAVGSRGVKGLEIECRFGKTIGTRFIPGVSKPAFEKLFGLLAASPAFEAVEVDTHEYLFQGRKYVVTQKDSSAPAPPPPRWTAKDVFFKVDVEPFLRGSVAYETDSAPTAPVDISKASFERVKRRVSFRTKEFRVDMTRVRTNLPDFRDEPEELYEIEVELDNPEIFYEKSYLFYLEFLHKTAMELCKLL